MENILVNDAVKLLKDLISIKSFSGSENKTADTIQNWFNDRKIKCYRKNNNVFALNKNFDKNKPTLLLNSHHDTVLPNKAYTKDPFLAHVEEGKLYGLGSNDAGGALVSLISTFTYFYDVENLKYNIVIAATAEEESSGPLGLNSLLVDLPKLDIAIVGEPTEMKLAIAEKGLLVLDVIIEGTPSHAAHENRDSAIEKLPDAINWFKNFKFEKKSKILGPVKVTVTQVNGGSQHNVIPSDVNLVVDIRVNDCYSNLEILQIIKRSSPYRIESRSLDLNSSSIDENHGIVLAASKIGMEKYGSPTLSDQAKLNFPSIKLGPGDSKRSHTANEFIYLSEITSGIDLYIKLLKEII